MWDAVRGAFPVVDRVRERASQLMIRRVGIVSIVIGQITLLIGLLVYLRQGVQRAFLVCVVAGAIAFLCGVVVMLTTQFLLLGGASQR